MTKSELPMAPCRLLDSTPQVGCTVCAPWCDRRPVRAPGNARRGGNDPRELARRMPSDPSTVRAMLVLLEKRGLVQRNWNPTDSRAGWWQSLRRDGESFGNFGKREIDPLANDRFATARRG